MAARLEVLHRLAALDRLVEGVHLVEADLPAVGVLWAAVGRPSEGVHLAAARLALSARSAIPQEKRTIRATDQRGIKRTERYNKQNHSERVGIPGDAVVGAFRGREGRRCPASARHNVKRQRPRCARLVALQPHRRHDSARFGAPPILQERGMNTGGFGGRRISRTGCHGGICAHALDHR